MKQLFLVAFILFSQNTYTSDLFGGAPRKAKDVRNQLSFKSSERYGIPKENITEVRLGQLFNAGIEDRKIIKMIISSIKAYPDNCPCPYNKQIVNRICGGTSAWSRAGGKSPKCYPSDFNKQKSKR